MTATYQVVYDFGGFLKPVKSPPAVNEAKAGPPLPPIKFSLHGDQGLDIFQQGYPASEAYTCGTQPPTTATVPAEPHGKNPLKYDPIKDEYQLAWESDKSWKNTCRVFILGLKDGTSHYLLYQFK